MNARWVCVLQFASVGTKAPLCGFNLIMNPTLSAFFCSPSKLVWLLAVFKCWSICLSVSAEITSATPCLPLGFHFIHLAQRKGIKRDDWLDASSSDKLLPIHRRSTPYVYNPKAKQIGSQPTRLLESHWHCYSFKLCVLENIDLLDNIHRTRCRSSARLLRLKVWSFHSLLHFEKSI